MGTMFRTHWPLIGAIVVLIGTIAVLLMATLRETEGHLVYTLDDAYIHMAMAKHLVQHGVYGVTQYEFSSSSSSPLWTVFLAFCFGIFGVHEILPFVLNLCLALTILVVLYTLLRRFAVNTVTITVALLAVTYGTPLPAMVFSGMEHLLHILLMILFLWFFERNVTRCEISERTSEGLLFLMLAGGLVLVRYESCAILVITGLFFLLRRRWMMAAGLWLAGLLPLVAYQLISVAHGWSWLPNSVLVRTGMADAAVATYSGSPVAQSPLITRALGLLSLIVQNAGAGVHLVALIVFSGILLSISLYRTSSFWNMRKVGVTVFILAACAHFMFGHIGHFFRYEAYLMATGLFASTCLVPDITPLLKQGLGGIWKRAILMLLFVASFIGLLIPLTDRSRDSLTLTPVAARNIYEQQYQMGTFLHRYYPTSSVAVNDIGAVSFLTDIHLVDLVGLASIDILPLKRSGEYDTGHIRKICEEHNVCVAIVYDSWLQRIANRGAPLSWTKVGEWRIFDNVVCSDDVVSLYAVQASEKEQLLLNLKEYSSVLPPRVEQTGAYVGSSSALGQQGK